MTIKLLELCRFDVQTQTHFIPALTSNEEITFTEFKYENIVAYPNLRKQSQARTFVA